MYGVFDSSRSAVGRLADGANALQATPASGREALILVNARSGAAPGILAAREVEIATQTFSSPHAQGIRANHGGMQ